VYDVGVSDRLPFFSLGLPYLPQGYNVIHSGKKPERIICHVYIR
jgi:hypothetical protein